MTAKKKKPAATEGEIPFDQEELDQAAQDEGGIMSTSVEVLIAQNKHLNNRVVLLRALVNRLQGENDRLRSHQPQDHQPKKRVAKKST